MNKAWRVTGLGWTGVTVATTRGAARWRMVQAVREAGYLERNKMPRDLRAVRAREFDGVTLHRWELVVNENVISERVKRIERQKEAMRKAKV